MNIIRLGVLFGSRSVEHEVSVITAVQLMKAANPQKYEVIPIYISKDGSWLSGVELKDLSFYRSLNKHSAKSSLVVNPTEILQSLDVALIACHGTGGEDGSLQGMLEMHQVPFQGPGVFGSAVCMDKIACKKLLRSEGLPIVDYQWFHADEWNKDSEGVLKRLKNLKFPLYVKPSNMGSSIGITKVHSEKELLTGIETALAFDDRILVEESIEDCIEVNVSVLGFESFRVSETEQPIKTGELLSYADKYTRSGGKKSGMASLNRRIPAPISSSFARHIQETARVAAKVLDCSGVVRMDFLADPSTETCYINEVNTIPGSFSFYLWEASGMQYTQLIDELVLIAQQRQTSARKKIRSIESNILG